MERNTILAIVLCVVFYVAYNKYLDKKYPDRFNYTVEQAGSSQPEVNQDKGPSSSEEIKGGQVSGTKLEQNAVPLAPEDLKFSNDDVSYEFDQVTASFKSVVLKKYFKNTENEEAVELLNYDTPSDQLVINASANFDSSVPALYQAERLDNTIKFSKIQNNWLITLSYTIPESGYSSNLKISYKNLLEEPRNLDTGINIRDRIDFASSSSWLPSFVPRNYFAIVGIDNSRKSEDLKSACDKLEAKSLLEGSSSTLDFIGQDLHYFVKLVKPKVGKLSYSVKKEASSSKEQCYLDFYLSQSEGMVEAGGEVNLDFLVFNGPKDVSTLVSVDESFKNTLYLGWFNIIAHPLLAILKAFYKVIPNYGIAIILLTFILKLLFYPLARTAAVSAKKMQQLQPAMAQIKLRYKDEPQKQQQEMMKFMSQNKINPAAGCLPVLPQIPVFIAFYNVLSQSIELRHTPFFGWIHDLSSPDPYLITPILLGVGMFLQQKLMPNTTMDKTQQKILMAMPIVFTVMMLSLPSGLVLYMLTNTLVSIIQQRRFNKILPAKLNIQIVEDKSDKEGKKI